MRDVAEHAGVSAQTVSNLVNNRLRQMSDETRLRIEGAMEQLGYHPNLTARSLRSARTTTIGFLLLDEGARYLADPMTDQVIAGVGDVARDRGYSVLIHAGLPGPPDRGPHDLERVLPRDRARALLLRFHPQPEKAETTAKIPSTAIARPLNVLIPRTTPGVRRARSSDAATTRMPHHAVEPSSTPATTEAGRISDPPVPKPSVAARAAKDTMVVGLVMVNPSVDA